MAALSLRECVCRQYIDNLFINPQKRYDNAQRKEKKRSQDGHSQTQKASEKEPSQKEISHKPGFAGTFNRSGILAGLSKVCFIPHRFAARFFRDDHAAGTGAAFTLVFSWREHDGYPFNEAHNRRITYDDKSKLCGMEAKSRCRHKICSLLFFMRPNRRSRVPLYQCHGTAHCFGAKRLCR